MMKKPVLWVKIFAAVFLLLLGGDLQMAVASHNPEISPGFLRINYQRSVAEYENYGLWFWDDGKNLPKDWPAGALTPAGKTSFGTFWEVELADFAQKISFLIVNRTNGEKDAGNKIYMINKAHNEIWVRENDDNVYVTNDFAAQAVLKTAKISDSNHIELNFTDKIILEPEKILPLVRVSDRAGNEVIIENLEIFERQVILSTRFDLARVPLRVEFAGVSVNCDLTWQMIDSLYAYDGDDLGCVMNSSQSASLKLWAPKAEEVKVFIFDRYDQRLLVAEKAMTRAEKGVWFAEINSDDLPEIPDLTGYYYQYEVKNPGFAAKKVLDPYARSMAAVTVSPDGTASGTSGDFVGKAAFVDPASFGKKPAPANIEGYLRRENAIIYEVHVRDFTSDPEIKDELEAEWGTFAAFKNRLSYIRSLGVTHVQLLPVMAWYFGDETMMRERESSYSSKNNQYNWGYDPHNYFSLDGAYSQNPENAGLRIAEFKELVDAIHQAGMGVILDVVYTHMAKASFLEDIVPGYYFFQTRDGSLLGDFGNNLATNRKMAEKLMVDSVKYWFENYRIDGMRWDMMGDATRESVQKAFDAAQAVNSSTIFIGEGWRTFKGHLEDPGLKGHGADQDWMAFTDSVGVFSDEFRNELKSGFGCEGEPMFLTGGKRNIQFLFNNIKAQPQNTPVSAPGDMVQYIAAHDNLPLFDVIAQSIKKDPDIAENFLEIHRRIRLGNLILLTSQGTAFIHAGQEFGRTKQWRAPGVPEHKFHEMVDADNKPFKYPYFIHDSYDSSDAINKFDWKKATDAGKFPVNVTTREFTSGLIRLRRSTDAFSHADMQQVDASVSLVAAPEIAEHDLVIAYSCRSSDKTLFHVFVNADSVPRKLTLKVDLTQAEVIVDARNAGTNALARPEGFRLSLESIELEPLTGVVFRSKK